MIFALLFLQTDQVIFTDIYAAREQNTYHISAADIASGVPGALYLAQTQWAKAYTLSRTTHHGTRHDFDHGCGRHRAFMQKKIADKSDAKTDACVTTK